MGKEEFGSFSTEGHGMPSRDEREIQNQKDWEENGAFVPQELRVFADRIFNANNLTPNFLADLNDPKKTKFIELLGEYGSSRDEARRKVIVGEVRKILK